MTKRGREVELVKVYYRYYYNTEYLLYDMFHLASFNMVGEETFPMYTKQTIMQVLINFWQDDIEG